jgi:hypothetical protein
MRIKQMRMDDINTDNITEEPYDPELAIDREAIEADIAAGAKAFRILLKNADADWNNWSITIVGLRGLRNLAFARAGVSDIRSWHYRDQLAALLQQKKYSVYEQIGKQTRSTCYKLMDSLEEIDTWYAGLNPEDKLRWKHPDAIAKNCPAHLVGGGIGGNQPKRARKKPQPKPQVTAETERLKTLLIQVIKRLAKHEPEALDLLDQVMPSEPDLDDDPGL